MINFLAIFILTLTLHAVHVSMSSMEYFTGENAYRITVRMYSDDLLLDLLCLYEIAEEDMSDHSYTGPDDLLEDYINEKIIIKINGQSQRARLVETEKLEIETIMRLSIDYEGKTESVDILNTILTGIYPDQVNLFIYKDQLNEHAVRFTALHMSEKIDLGSENLTR